jgi:hypothetical protein
MWPLGWRGRKGLWKSAAYRVRAYRRRMGKLTRPVRDKADFRKREREGVRVGCGCRTLVDEKRPCCRGSQGPTASASHAEATFQDGTFLGEEQIGAGETSQLRAKETFYPSNLVYHPDRSALIGPIQFLQRFTALLDSRPHKRAPSLSLARLSVPPDLSQHQP